MNLTPDNIVLDEKWHPKVIAWGESEPKPEDSKVYQAPEIQNQNDERRYQLEKIDSWAVGIIIY